MSVTAFDLLARRAAITVTRRSTVAALGGSAVIAGFAIPSRAEAGKVARKAKKRCRRQGDQCRAFFAESCKTDFDPAECFELSPPCCDFLAACEVGAFFTCLQDARGPD